MVMHDGARPLISADLIAHTIATPQGNIDADGAVVAHPAIDTLESRGKRRHRRHARPQRVLNAQTPQVFRGASTAVRTPRRSPTALSAPMTAP